MSLPQTVSKQREDAEKSIQQSLSEAEKDSHTIYYLQALFSDEESSEKWRNNPNVINEAARIAMVGLKKTNQDFVNCFGKKE